MTNETEDLEYDAGTWQHQTGTMNLNTHATRESWLTAAYVGLQPLFTSLDHPIKSPVRIAMGFPSSGALSMKRPRIGECWSVETSTSGHVEIMVSPLIDDTLEIIATVAHELGHAVLGPKVGHKKPFANLMVALGLEGKAASTRPGALFKQRVEPLLEQLGPFPHARLIPLSRDKKEKVKIFKCSCSECGYTARVIRRWLEEAGAPLCPIDRIPLIEG